MLVLVAALGASRVVGSRYGNSVTLPGTGAQRASDLLARGFPAQAGDGDQIVFHTPSRTVTMMVVFASFIGGGQRVIEMFGLALASAVFLDALVIRVLLLPATLQLLGERPWWFPDWLDRRLPRFTLEPAEEAPAEAMPGVPKLEPVGS